MRMTFIVLQILFTIALIGGFWLWWQLDHLGHGYQPEAGFLRWWHNLDGQPEFYLLIAQLAYPFFWLAGRGIAWSTFWRIWRSIHLVLVLLLLLATGLLWLATPDLGGNWG